MKRRLVVATRSAHKLRELRQLLDLPASELVSLDELGIAAEADEPFGSFEENALAKAAFYARLGGSPTLADDSGLEVDALDGAPGVRTRRFAGEHATDEQNNTKLLAVLREVPTERRGARYVCALCYVDPAGDGPVIRVGRFEGRIAERARGSGGFGYDPIFEPASEPPGGRTVAQLSVAEKNAVSHRAVAARAMAEPLRSRGY